MDCKVSDIWIRELHCELIPAQSPFEVVGPCRDKYRFVYMTNRRTGRWSHLIAPDMEIMTDLSRTVSVGYTQLWVFEKRYATSLANQFNAERTSDIIKAYPATLDRTDWPGRLFVVLREPISFTISPDCDDIVAYHTSEPAAVACATQYTQQHARRAVVGLLLDDCYWH